MTAAKVADKVTVLFSGGKDSVVTFDLCRRYFNSVDIAFMYFVNGLSFQEKIIQYYENLYDLECLRVPHFELSNMLRYRLFRKPDYSVPIILTKDVYNYIRSLTDNYWLAGGERINDSIVRRAMIKKSGSIDEKRGRFYPLADWSKQDVIDYIRKNRLKVSEESRVLGFSFRDFSGKTLIKIKECYPNDFERIKNYFPFCEAGIRKEQHGEKQT
jgi:phosphoadenosine phosphosulfate reductase